MTTKLNYNGQLISQRADGYVNATHMAKANNVLINDWSRLATTQAYTQELSIITNIPVMDLMVSKKGGVVQGSGTWLHPLLALNFGRWISPSFAIWCDQHIKTLMETGKTELLDQPQKHTLQQKLDTIKAIQTIPTLRISEALKQVLLDSIGDEYLTKKALPEATERLLGVVQKAEELGFRVDASSRTKLGKYTSDQAHRLVRQKETRLCNGSMREIWVYLDNESLETVVREYFV